MIFLGTGMRNCIGNLLPSSTTNSLILDLLDSPDIFSRGKSARTLVHSISFYKEDYEISVVEVVQGLLMITRDGCSRDNMACCKVMITGKGIKKPGV